MNKYPLIAKVECGLFGIQDDHMEKYLSLDQYMVSNKSSTFFFRASGESMQPFIMPGDIVVVDRSKRVESQDICIVELEGELLCKRFIKLGERGVLRSENPKFKDVYLTNFREASFFGVVTGISRRFIDL